MHGNVANNEGTAPAVLSVTDLSVVYPTPTGEFTAVEGVSFDVQPGEIVGLVGESGAGKSTVGNAIVRLIDFPGRIRTGRVVLGATDDLTQMSEPEMCKVRGRRIGMIFQDPLTALSPVVTVGAQLMRAIALSTGLRGEEARDRALALFAEVGIPDPAARLRQYPHQFSGGMRQRVVIAIALAGDPELLIADEPTTALDVSIQSEVLELLRRLGREHEAGVILVTHDMAVINEVADRVAVMRRGRVVEFDRTARILGSPREPYTQSLIRAVPRTDVKLTRFELVDTRADGDAGDFAPRHDNDWFAEGVAAHSIERGAPLVQVEDLRVTFRTHNALLARNRRYLNAVDGVSFEIRSGETFGIVGESGSGKSTVARVICGLQSASEGQVRFLGAALPSLSRQARLSMQMIFQDPFSSLNPRQRVGTLLSEPLRIHRIASRGQSERLVSTLLERVGLQAEDARKLPHQFSGGQRQRICIARALAMRPAFLICDEPTSALDVSVQAQVLNLLKDLQTELGLTMLFINHNLAVIRQMCDRVAVMKAGQICELGDAGAVFDSPTHDYTRHLLERMPKFTPVTVGP